MFNPHYHEIFFEVLQSSIFFGLKFYNLSAQYKSAHAYSLKHAIDMKIWWALIRSSHQPKGYFRVRSTKKAASGICKCNAGD